MGTEKEYKMENVHPGLVPRKARQDFTPIGEQAGPRGSLVSNGKGNTSITPSKGKTTHTGAIHSLKIDSSDKPGTRLLIRRKQPLSIQALAHRINKQWRKA